MSTSNYQTEKVKKHTKAVLLLEIDIVGDGNNSRTLYLADKYLTIESTNYEGIVQSWGGMDMTIFNEGLSAISDYSIILANDRLNYMTTDTCISDIFDSYYWAGSVCRVYQWFEDLTLKTDAELIFKGMVKQPSFDLNEVRFDIQESNSIHQNVPLDIVTLNNYPEAPDESIGNPLPMVFGNDWDWTDKISSKACVSPCIETDKNLKTFYIASHKVEHANLDTGAMDVLIYVDGRYGYISATNHTYTNNSDGARFILQDNIAYAMYLFPELQGSQYSSAIADYSNTIDNSSSSVIQLGASETFYLKLKDMPSAVYENDATAAITLFINVNAVTGSSPYGVLTYYNPNWNGAGTNFSAGTNITGTGGLTFDLVANKDKKGIRADNDDQDDRWTKEDLLSLEYGITVSAGCTIDISIIRIYVSRLPLFYTKLGTVTTRYTGARL
jgi:hypothetical protein